MASDLVSPGSSLFERREESGEVKCSTASHESSRHSKRQTFEGPGISELVSLQNRHSEPYTSVWPNAKNLRDGCPHSLMDLLWVSTAQVRSADGLRWR